MHVIAYGPDELVNQYQDLSSGHFFDSDTMRFFRSRLTSHYKRLSDTEALFITTESNFDRSKRFATVRRAKLITYIRDTDGRDCQKIEIEEVGEFNTMSLAQAKTVLKKYEW